MRNWPLLNFCLTIFFCISANYSVVKPIAAVMGRSHLSSGFLFHRTVSMNQKACSCRTSFSCACCQSVTILLRGIARNCESLEMIIADDPATGAIVSNNKIGPFSFTNSLVCVNFNYQRTGLSMNITLGSTIIRQVSIIDYRAFKVCTSIPDCRYSFACVDVVELSLFPRSITICVQLDVMSKTDNWQINYNCISISTDLSAQSNATTIFPPTTTNIVLNGSTGMTGMQPNGTPGTGQMPSNPAGMPPGQMPPGQTGMTTGQMPAGQMPPGQMPSGQMPPAQMPPGQMPAGQIPPGQMPPGQMPPGQMPPGPMPPGQMPPGPMPPGPMPPGPMPPGPMPPGQMGIPPGQMPMPPSQMQGMVSRRVRLSVHRSARSVSGLSNWTLKRKSKKVGGGLSYRMMKNGVDIRRLKSNQNNERTKMMPLNELPKNILQEKGFMVKDGHRKLNESLANAKIDIGHYNARRERRNVHKRSSNAAMKMQVILRNKKNRLPKRIAGNESRQSFKTMAIYPAARNSKIVNGDTVSIPMAEIGPENVVTSGINSLNNFFTLVGNGSQVGFTPPQPIPASPPSAVSVATPFFVLQNGPWMDDKISPNFSINYDNRTSSFPDRMPPSFGMASRSGLNDKRTQSFERSVEELETIGPEIQLSSNSKIIEMQSTTDTLDGRIIFPE